MNPIAISELPVNKDGSIYHLHLHPEQLADTILLVGDPQRVPMVSAFFDHIEVKVQNRELCTHTGLFQGKRISVLSTGMGTDNIDIVVNELDALANIDLDKGEIKPVHRSLNLIRIGTCGILQPDIPLNSMIVSEHVMGLDGLVHFYENPANIFEKGLKEELLTKISWPAMWPNPYFVKSSALLFNKVYDQTMHKGITITAPGFYGPQGRKLRLSPAHETLFAQFPSLSLNSNRFVNFEMETSAIYGLGQMLGHQTLTVCLGIANRSLKTFSSDYEKYMKEMILYILKKVC